MGFHRNNCQGQAYFIAPCRNPSIRLEKKTSTPQKDPELDTATTDDEAGWLSILRPLAKHWSTSRRKRRHWRTGLSSTSNCRQLPKIQSNFRSSAFWSTLGGYPREIAHTHTSNLDKAFFLRRICLRNREYSVWLKGQVTATVEQYGNDGEGVPTSSRFATSILPTSPNLMVLLHHGINISVTAYPAQDVCLR